MNGLHIFLNGARGLAVVDHLAKKGHAIDAVFVPASRLSDGALPAEHNGLSLTGVVDVNDPQFVRATSSRKPRLLIIAGFSTIFEAPLIETAVLGAINLHAGRLPEYRGGSPLNWQIINCETCAGICVVRVGEGIDNGDVLAEASIPIGPDDDIASLHDRANEVFPALVEEVLTKLESGETGGRVQDSTGATYWHQRKDADGFIDFERMTVRQVHNLIRAVTRPYPGAFAFCGESRVRIFRTRIVDAGIRGIPGRVVWLQGEGPYVVCADRALLVEDYRFDTREQECLHHGARLGPTRLVP